MFYPFAALEQIGQEPLSSSVPIGTTAQHKLYSAQSANVTVSAIVADIGGRVITAEIFGTIPYGGVTTVPANITLDLQNGQIDCQNNVPAVIINGPVLQSGGRQVFKNCPAGAISFLNNSAIYSWTPQMWGAKGDGITVDTIPWQAALDAKGAAGGVVTPPCGLYLLNAHLTITYGSTVIRGPGGYTDSAGLFKPCARLLAQAGLAEPLLQSLAVGPGLHGVEIERMGFFGPGAVSGSRGLYVVSAQDWTLRDLFFSSFGDQAIKYDNAVAGLIDRVSVQNALLVRTGRTDYVGAIEIDGTDFTLRNVYSTTSTTAGEGVGSGFLAAFVLRAVTAFVTNCVGQVSQTGWVVQTSSLLGAAFWTRFVGNRADLNFGNGFIINGNRNSFVGNAAFRNSQSLDGGYSGFVTSGFDNTFEGNSVDSLGGDAKWQGDAFTDTNTNAIPNYYSPTNVALNIRGALYAPSAGSSARFDRTLAPTDIPETCIASRKGMLYFDLSLNEECECNGASWCIVGAPATCGSSSSCGTSIATRTFSQPLSFPPFQYTVATLPTFARTVLALSPVAYWRMDDAAGNLVDIVNANAAVAHGAGVTYHVAGSIVDDSNFALTMPGAGNPYWQVATSGTLPAGDVFSVAFAFKKAVDGTIMRIWDQKLDGFDIAFDALNVIDVLKASVGGSGQVFMHSSTAITGTAWHYGTIIKNGATRKLLVDGVDITTLSTNQTLAPADATEYFGIFNNGTTSDWNGSLDEFAIWNRELTSAEAVSLYAAWVIKKNGQQVYGLDCTPNTSPAAALGAGAIAKYEQNQWDCATVP